MNPSTPSRTALATSLIRALHSHDPAPLLNDPWGERLVPPSVQQRMGERVAEPAGGDTTEPPPAGHTRTQALRASRVYANVILRARYTEDALQAAVARGIDQYVIVGAGFDSFICRRPAWAEGLSVYEVDHPATQKLKRERLAACDVALPDTVQFVEADLATESLAAALARSSFRADRPTFFAWLGVTMYLTREANLAALRTMATCGAAGSELVFSYLDEAVLDPGHAASVPFREMQAKVAGAGEPFLSGFDPLTLPQLLRETGLQLLEDLDDTQSLARYDPAGLNGLRAQATGHVAHARTMAVASTT